MKKLTIDHGSFRDPDARVAYSNDSVYRVVYSTDLKNSISLKKFYKINQSLSI